MDRRSLLGTSTTMGLSAAVGALAGCALPGQAQQAPRTPFTVADTR